MPHVTPEFGLFTLASCFVGQRPIGDLMARLMLLTIIVWVARVWCRYGRRGADFSDPPVLEGMVDAASTATQGFLVDAAQCGQPLRVPYFGVQPGAPPSSCA